MSIPTVRDLFRRLKRAVIQLREVQQCARGGSGIPHGQTASVSKYCADELTISLLAGEAGNRHSAKVLSFSARFS